ncbi:hypothetical protein [Neobacillus drentensis]|uniref:hypothetical protein n=1 Tax=Neobacillus drentensis TaxID=220684 RepID=UPI002861D217|nr:hypothetical protein [Neobacillus drentensis]MDR7236523.1 hypothetical protein [Neobacillus drentensis]
MERIRPILQNKTEIPVNIYKGEELLKECPSIQQAARFFKKHTGTARYNWSAINKGIWFNEPYSINGATYFFLTDSEAVKKKLEELQK